MRRIIIHKDLCTGCKSCVVACMTRNCSEKHKFDSFIDVNKDKYFIDLSNIDTESRNHIELNYEESPVPLTCRHCDKPECVATCMSGAMTKDSITGIVSYDEKRCGSCYMCVMSCPYGILKPDDRTKQDIIKCDLCKEEDIPLCVYNCPSGALELQSEEVELSSDVATTSQENIKTYVIVGASIAGITAVKTIRELDKSAKIIVVSKDEKIYSRCMLHHVISGHRTIDGINFVDEDFIKKQDATWIKKATLKSIDPDNKKIKYEKDNKGEELAYDKLLITAGANAFIPPIKNLRDAKNVYPLRNIEDAVMIREKAKYSKRIVIMGAGLVGMDALAGLVELDNVGTLTLIASEDRILDKQLDIRAAKVYEDKFEQKGVKILKNCMASEVFLDEDGNIKGIGIKNGEIIPCDLLIVSTGVRSNIEIVKGSGIETEKGIKINEKCETNKQDIYAAGDITGTGIWPLATKQAQVAATNMAGKKATIDDTFEFKNTMNFMGIPTVSIGFITPADDTYDVFTYTDGENYKKAVIKDNVLTGFIAQGDISYVGVYTQLIKDKIKVENLKERVFDLGYSDFFKIKEDGQFEW